jgi:chemotaxis protein CheD
MEVSAQTNNIIEVGIAEAKIALAPVVLITRGLGSCLGITLYDAKKKIGGLAHPMLPRIGESHLRSNPFKFVDHCLPYLLDELIKQGAKKENITAKIFGGAHMFNSVPNDTVFNVGARNSEEVRAQMAKHHIKIIAEDIGGNYGRTLFFNLDTGNVRVRTMFFGEKEL